MIWAGSRPRRRVSSSGRRLLAGSGALAAPPGRRGAARREPESSTTPQVFGGPRGGHRAATILGIVATCHRIGVDVLSYLGWVFTAVGPAARDPAAMTPAAFKLKTA